MRAWSRRACLWLTIAQTLVALGVQGLHQHHSTRSVGPACEDTRLHIERRDGIEPTSRADDCLACRARADLTTPIDAPEPTAAAPPLDRVVFAVPSIHPSLSYTFHAIRGPPIA